MWNLPRPIIVPKVEEFNVVGISRYVDMLCNPHKVVNQKISVIVFKLSLS
jgi:hypothetical protein